MRSTTRFKELVLSPEILMMPVAHDPLCAKIAVKAGFDAVCSAGYTNSAAYLGKPDIGLMTLTEMVDCAARIVDAVEVPVMADGDTGHGNVNNVIRTMRLHEKAGIAAIFFEDQVSPKRCGHMAGKQVVAPQEMVSKLKAALDTRIDSDFMIMARTDALGVNGIDDAIERANLYLETGADMIFVEAVETIEQMRRILKEVKAPHLANMIPGGKSPNLTAKELQDIGYALVVYPTINTYAVAKTTSDLFSDLRKNGSFSGFSDRMFNFDEFNSLVGLQEIRQTEMKYTDTE
jgi:2,3-dimethylmalate lyase